jgi:hypothetical protein
MCFVLYLKQRFMERYFFAENTVTGVTYLAVLQNWLLPQASEDSEDLIFQQDGAPPHWHRDVRRFLNESLPQRWIGRVGERRPGASVLAPEIS